MMITSKMPALLIGAACSMPVHGQPAPKAPASDAPVSGALNQALRVQLGAAAGNSTSSPSAGLTWEDKNAKFAYSVVANWTRNRMDRMLDGQEHSYAASGLALGAREIAQHESGAQEHIHFQPRLTWFLANGDTVSLNTALTAEHGRRHLDTVSTVLAGAAPAFEKLDQQLRSEQNSVKSDLNWSHRISPQSRLELQLLAGYTDDAHTSRWQGFDHDGDWRKDSATWSNGIDKSLGTSGKFAHDLAAGHQLVSAWSVHQTQRDASRSQRESAASASAGLELEEAYWATVKRSAMHVQDEWKVTPQLSATLGARWDRIDIRTAGSALAAAGSSTSIYSPIVQARYQVPSTHGDLLRLNVARAVTVPGTAQLVPSRALAPNNAALEPDTSGNALLRPERSLGLEAAYEHRFATPGARLSLTAARRKIHNLIKQVVKKGADGRWVAAPLNSGDASSRSLGAELALPLKLAKQAAPAIELRTAYTHHWSAVHAVRGPNNTIPGQIPYIAKLGLDVKQPDLNLGATFSVRGGGWLRISEQRQRYQDVRRDLDLFATWKLDRHTTLRASALLAQAWKLETRYQDGVGPSFARSLTTPANSSLRLVWERRY